MEEARVRVARDHTTTFSVQGPWLIHFLVAKTTAQKGNYYTDYCTGGTLLDISLHNIPCGADVGRLQCSNSQSSNTLYFW